MAKAKKHQQEKLIDDLMISEGDAREILDSHAELSKRRIQAVQERILKDEEKRAMLEQKISSIRSAPGPSTGKFSSGITSGTKSAAQSIKTNEPTEILDIYKVEDEESDLKGPKCPNWTELSEAGYLNHVVHQQRNQNSLVDLFQVTRACARCKKHFVNCTSVLKHILNLDFMRLR